MSPRERQVPPELQRGGKVMTWSELTRLGRSESEAGLRAVEAGQAANEAAMLIYTSGTTGHPKG